MHPHDRRATYPAPRYVLTPDGPVYATGDAGGRLYLCPASLRLATDPEFRRRVEARTAERVARMRSGTV